MKMILPKKQTTVNDKKSSLPFSQQFQSFTYFSHRASQSKSSKLFRKRRPQSIPCHTTPEVDHVTSPNEQ